MRDRAVRPHLRRWLRFNAVGATGTALQLGLLALLTRVAGWPYLPATLVAVELTVLHNLAWHEGWTWRDRPARSRSARLVRAARFHGVAGAVSLAGNVTIMWLVAGRLGLDPILANVLAIAACSLLNFVGSDRLVFATTRRGAVEVPRLAPKSGEDATGRTGDRCRPPAPYPAAPTLIATLAVALLPVHLAGDSGPVHPATLVAWTAYERQVDARYTRDTGAAFFAADTLGGPGSWRPDALAGATPMFQARAAAAGLAAPDVPDGRIHHWVGATFVPGRTVAEVIDSLEAQAGREAGAYDDVIASRLLSRDGDRVHVFLKLRRTKIVTATYNTEHRVEYRRIEATRGSSRSVATRIVELADAGTATEREKTPDEDSGYLWRLNAYWRFEQAGGGVLIECESVSLSRAAPSLLRPFISGIVEGVARESLERTLLSVRRALTAGTTTRATRR